MRNGFIADGSTDLGFRGDLLIENGRIREVARGAIEVDCETIDCSGLVAAPGFIDAHSHMDWVLAIPGFEHLKTPFTAQGCTTFVTGNCGFSPAGFRPGSEYKQMIKLGIDRAFDIDWDDMEGYFDHVRRVGLTHNMVHLAGHGTTQISMRGLNPAPLTAEERRELLDLLAAAMDQGAAGVSFGLGYEPGMFLPFEDIMAIARLVKDRDRIMTVHGRAYSRLSGFYREREGTPHNVLSLEEMIEVARRTGVRLQYSHLMFAGTRTHDTYRQCLETIDRALALDIDVMTDTYPYHCGNSVINVLLPPWFLADLPKNYEDPQALERVEHGLDAMSRHVGFGYGDVQLTFANHPEFDAFNGMFIDEIAAKMKIPPARVVVQLSEKTGGRARVLNHNYSTMEVIDALMAHPACLYMTDAVVAVQGVQNPACSGAFPLLLQYARDRYLLSMEEAVNKMTGAVAERFGITDRGFLRPGMAADITVFDWERVRDNNTVKKTDRPPDGIEHVFINGRQVKRRGRVDSAVKAGEVIKT